LQKIWIILIMSQDFPFELFLNSSAKNLKTLDLANTIIKETSAAKKTENTAEESMLAHEAEEISRNILSHLKNSVSSQKFSAYFDNNFSLKTIRSGRIEFSVPTPFIKTILERHYMPNINEAIIGTLGKEFAFSISVAKTNSSPSSNQDNILHSLQEKKGELDRPKQAKEVKFSLPKTLVPTKDDLNLKVESKYLEHLRPSDLGVVIDKKKTFDSFIIGPSNNLAYATARAISGSPGKAGKYPSLYIYSDSGLGKTHLLHAVANGIQENFPSLTICLITARDFQNEMVAATLRNDITSFQKKYSEKVDVLMIDDIHELKNKKGTQNEFFHIFNELYIKGKQLIFTSDKTPKEIDGIEERIKTRLQWGLVIDIQKPDLETRIAILKKKAYEIDLFIHDDLFQLIAQHTRDSIRELEGALVKLSAYSDVMNVEIDADIVKELLAINSNGEQKKHSLDTISKACASHYKVHVADLKSKTRSKEITMARHVAMYLSHKIIGATLQEIGAFYGGRDHTSIIHAIRKVKELISTNGATSKEVSLIENTL